jgi:hypothetical protein
MDELSKVLNYLYVRFVPSLVVELPLWSLKCPFPRLSDTVWSDYRTCFTTIWPIKCLHFVYVSKFLFSKKMWKVSKCSCILPLYKIVLNFLKCVSIFRMAR